MAAVATGGGSGLSAALVGVVQVGGEGKGERGVIQEGPELVRPLAEPGGIGHGSRGRDRGGEEGDNTTVVV